MERGVEVISLWEFIDLDSTMGRAMLHQAIVFAGRERDLARERPLAGLKRDKATGKHLGRRKGISRKRAEEIQNMRRRDGLSWGRIATITALPASSIRRIYAPGTSKRKRRRHSEKDNRHIAGPRAPPLVDVACCGVKLPKR